MTEPSRSMNGLLAIVEALPRDLSPDDLQAHVDVFLRVLRKSLPNERPLVMEALVQLRKLPAIVPVLVARYAATERLRFYERFVLVQILGALQRKDALADLVRIAWNPLPPQPKVVHCTGVSQRAAEEIVCAKAVQGILYLRTDDAYAEGERIIADHESLTVRVAAVDAYMWNREDSDDAADRLYVRLPREFHPYVQRPRYHRGMNGEHFEMQMLTWMKRWAPNGKLPRSPTVPAHGPSSSKSGG